MTPQDLSQFPLFAGVSDEVLGWLIENSHPVEWEEGTLVFQEGAPAEAFYILLEGTLQIVKRVGNEDQVVARHGPGLFTGEIPLLLGEPYFASAWAVAPSRALKVSDRDFETLVVTCPPLRRLIFRAFAQRLQSTEAQAKQNEKMASLGLLSAGISHELNNPAAAAQRASETLDERLGQLIGRTFPNLEGLAEVRRPNLDPLEKFELVDRVRQLLPGTLSDLVAERLVDAGLTPALVQRWAQDPATPSVDWDHVLLWLESRQRAQLIHEATKRISSLVSAVKTYTYRDQPGRQRVRVQDGLRDTLTLLDFKRPPGVQVQTQWGELPTIEARGGELNQVWTNLIDNAFDAMGREGTLTIQAWSEAKQIVVEFHDTGPGIPADLQDKIFEPFFTTKGVGQGTGLGLATVWRLVRSHGGTVRVQSHPGDTRFQVVLPLETNPTTLEVH